MRLRAASAGQPAVERHIDLDVHKVTAERQPKVERGAQVVADLP
jgi:hypothetical protein